MPKDMNMKPIVKYFQQNKQIQKNKEQNFKTKSHTQQNAMDVGQVTILLRTEQKIPHIYISYGEQKTLNEI